MYKFIIRNKQHNTKTEKETGIIPEYEKQKFCRNYLLGEWGSIQMTVTVSGLPLNSKFFKMGREAMRGGDFSMVWNVGKYFMSSRKVGKYFMSSQHYKVSLCITDICLLEWLCFLEVDISFYRLCSANVRRAKGGCLWILEDNIHIRSSFYTVYS